MQAQSVPCRARWRQRISGDTATGVTWMPKTLAENRKTEPVLSCCKSSMTSALFSPRSKEIHWSEIGEILTLNGQGRTIKIWTAEMALANDRARRFQASEARRLQDAWGTDGLFQQKVGR
jgi:hypothetical protein